MSHPRLIRIRPLVPKLAALIFGFCAAAAWADGGAGTSVAPVFKLGAGARPAGMGSAFVSVADDANASAWNPAGLSLVKRRSVSFMHYSLFESVNYEYLGYAQPLGHGAGLGAHVIYVFTDNINRTFEDAGGAFDPSRGGDTFRNSDLKLNFSGALKPLDWLAVGAGVNYFQDKVGDNSAGGVLGDVGFLASPRDSVSLGASLLNCGASDSPAQLRIGGHWRAWPGGLIAAGYDYALDSKRRTYSVGAEHWFKDIAALRAGYQLGDSKDAGGSRYSAGMGWKINSLQVDYAFSLMGELGNTHRVSLTFSFGADREGAAGLKQETAETMPQAPPARQPIAPEVEESSAPPSQLQQFITDLKNSDWHTRRKAAFALAELKAVEAVEPLLELLNDKNGAVREGAARALGRIGDKRALQPLIGALKNKSAKARAGAAKGLGYLGDKRAIKPLERLSRDKNKIVRKEAISALDNLQ